MTDQKSGAEALVEGLERWGIDTVFGLPGVHLDPFFDALHPVQNRIRVLHARHEQGAAYMAFGSAMATGRPSVFAVVPGPGFLNTTAALATAYACNTPVLCIVGTVVRPLLDKGYGALHELPDQSGMVQRLTKWSARVTDAAMMPALLDEAFRQMLSGRPRPVALEIPPEVLAQRTDMPAYGPLPQTDNPLPSPESIAAAADLVQQARRPLIVVGGGAQHAAGPVRALAEAAGIPVASRQTGRGILPDGHPLSILAYAANPLWAETDLVIGIGTRLQQLREWGDDPALKVIRIDIDPAEHDRIRGPDVGIVADAAAATQALADELAARAVEPATVTGLDDARKAFAARVEADVPLQKAYLDAIRAALPEDGVLVDEITQVGHAAKLATRFERPRSLITSGYQGTLGYGFATALGAQAALGDRVVVSINGDGGLLYTLPELATAVLHDIPLVAIVFNDSSYGNVETIQERWYGNRVIATALRNPDFVALAESFGALGLKAETPDDLQSALHTAIAARRPTLIEVPVSKGAMGWVWDLIIPKKVRGEGIATPNH
jgi:acetolactate synthase-1/2/3 large subunit